MLNKYNDMRKGFKSVDLKSWGIIFGINVILMKAPLRYNIAFGNSKRKS